ncbi:MAG TPA: hypothetical protein VIQ24_03260 [Pyrinomonadaceae bacterium]
MGHTFNPPGTRAGLTAGGAQGTLMRGRRIERRTTADRNRLRPGLDYERP